MLSDWGYTLKEEYVCLENILKLLYESEMNCLLKEDELDYNALFNDKVYSMITTGKTAELLEEYEKKYVELVDKSLFMKKGVIDHNNYGDISNVLGNNGFFEAKNEIILNAKDGSKVHKCYRGMESEECCNSRVEDAVKRRTSNLILIFAIGLIVIAVTIKSAGNESFVEQISFASTITSIILSVIAIWMSITGERTTNEVRIKVSEASFSLNETTKTSRELTSELKRMLNEQNDKYKFIVEKMEMNINNSQQIEKHVVDIKDLFYTTTEKTYNNPCEMLENVLDSIKINDIKLEIIETIEYIIANRPIGASAVYEHLTKRGFGEKDAALIVGITYTCCKNGLKDRQEELVTLKSKYKKIEK